MPKLHAQKPARGPRSRSLGPRSGYGRMCLQEDGLLESCDCRTVGHLLLTHPAAQVRFRDSARPRERSVGVLQAFRCELAHPFLDCGNRLIRVLEAICCVADSRARVAYEIGKCGN